MREIVGRSMATLSYLLAFWLVLCKPSEASYSPIYETEAQIFYNESGDFRRFPDDDQVAPEYFINELNFNAIDGSVLIGAADTLYLLDHALQLQDDYAWATDPGLLSACTVTDDNPEFACRNHIRVYKRIPANEDLLFVCGTQAGEDPQCRTVDISGGLLGSGSTAVTATDGLISYFPEFLGFGQFRNADPSDTTFFTASLFDGANGVGRHFSISYQSINFTNPSDPNTLETTERFRTINDNNDWLRYPVTFVDYYEADYEPRSTSSNPDEYKFYFIFFRENFYNRDVALDMIYSRVARVCRNDPGAIATGINYFSTFMKARIYCRRTMPSTRDFVGTINYDYSAITSMVFNDEGRYYENGDWIKMMYGAFTSPINGPSGSALCAYRADNQGAANPNDGIFEVFQRDLLNNGNDEDTEVPQNFFECDPAGRTSDEAMRRVLITQDVAQLETEPLLVLDDVQITQLVLDRVCIVRSQDNSSCVNQDVLFLGTDVGKVLKVVFGLQDTGERFPIIAEEILLDDDGTIHRMLIQEVNMTKYLYISTVSKIYRLPLERCTRNENCSECIGSRDPYCVWNTMNNTCQASTLTATNDAQGSVPNNIQQNIHAGELPSLCDFVTVMFSEATYSFAESDGNITLTLVKSGTTNSNATFLLSTVDETASAGTDYGPLSEYEITFAPDEYEKTVDISVFGDSVLESVESFLVELSLPLSPSQVGVGIGERNTTRVIIRDDDNVTISFQPVEYNVSEDDISVGIMVVKEGSSEIPVSVLLSTATFSATAPDDYSPRDEVEIVFEPVNTELVHQISIVNDEVVENSETFQVTLSLPTEAQTGVILGQTAVTVTIIDNDVVTVGWQTVEYNVSENCGSVSITIMKQGFNAIPVTVLFSTSDMEASAPDDFTSFTERMISFESDTLIEIIQVSVVNDGVHEPSEAFAGVLTTPTGQTGVQIGDATTTITIFDDDAITFELEALTQNASESDGFITVTIMKQGTTVSNQSVTFSTTDSTALASDDYDTTSETLLFLSDESQKTVTIALINDNTVEITETFLGFISLPFNEPGVQLGQDSATYIINDDDSIVVEFESSLYTVSEGSACANITITKTGSNDVALKVLIRTSDGNATGPNDYDPTEDQVIFVPTAGQQTISIAINDDQVLEGPESFFVALSIIDNQRGVQIGLSDAQIVIVDNDVITLEFQQSVCTASEADGAVKLVVTKNGLSSDAVSVFLSTVNGSASDSEDYTAVDEFEVNFDPNQLQQTITISIMNDEVFESTEQFSARLILSETQVGVQLGLEAINITIIDDDTVTIGFTAADYTVSENSSSITIAVSRNGSAAIPIAFTLFTVDNNAAAGFDYTETNVDVMLNPNDSELSINIPVLSDNIVEARESFNVRLLITSSQSGIQLGQDSATVVIEDDDTVMVRFDSEEYSVSEENGYVNVTIIKNGLNAIDIPVTFYTSDQDATAFDDYAPTEREITFNPASTQEIVSIYIRNDQVLETSESFLAMLSIPSGQQNVELGISTTQITISDDDVVMIQFEQVSCTIFEDSGIAEIIVTKTGLHATAISVLFSTQNGSTADSGDYVTVTGLEVNFDPNTFQQTVFVTITDDEVLESTEGFSARLTLPDNQQGVQLGDNIINITIIDDDSVTIGMASTEYSISEDAGVVNVIVNKIGSSDIPISVTFETMNGTAVGVLDYVETSMAITLEPSDTETIVTIPIINDDVQESQESFLVRLIAFQTRIQLIQDSSTITITDDDVVTVQLSSSEYNINEDNGYVNVTVIKNGVSASATSVLFSTSDQTATAPDDYIPIENEILFQPGLNEQLISLVIPILNDELQEPSESFLGEITIPGLQPGTQLGQATTTITITDDDRISVGFNATEYVVSEADGTITIEIVKYGLTTRVINVEFSTQDDSATAQDDYSSTLRTIAFAPDSFQETVIVPIVNDVTAEPQQRFYGRIAITNSQGVDLSAAVTSVSIIDDDVVTVGFAEEAYTVSESDGYFNISIVKDGPTGASISILLIGAAAAEDFTIGDTEISLAANSLEEVARVQLVADDIHEPTDTFQLSLSMPNDQEIAVQLNPNTATMTIRDDDSITVGFKQENYATSENCGSVSITLTKTGSTTLPIALQFRTVDGTATAPTDYITSESMVTFQPSDVELTIAVTVVNDDQIESSESFTGRLVLLNNQERVQIVPDTVIITVADGNTGGGTNSTVSQECQFEISVVAGVIAALGVVIVILIMIVIILACYLDHYKRRQKYGIESKTDIPLNGIGVSNIGFEDTDAPLKLGQVAKRQEAEGEPKLDIDPELKDFPEDTEIEHSHL